MAEASITPSREILDCPICLEQYQTPRSLPCLHTFCEECLSSYISSQVDNTTDFSCPVCRSTVTPTNHKSPAGCWAQTFPLNHLIVTLMDGGMENKDDVRCTLCQDVRDDSSVKAVYWCNDCCEGICEKCYTYHQKNKSNSRHKSGLIGETTVTINANADIDENCPRHHGKILEVYCSDHSELCCVVCFATTHRECKQINSIDDVSEGFNVDEVCSKFSDEMRNIEQGLLTIASDKEANIEKVGEEVKAITTEISDTVDKAKMRLDSVRDTLICDVKHKYETEKQKLQHQQKRVQAFEKDVKNCSKVMTSVSTGTRRQAFVTFEKMKSQLVSHYHQLETELANDVDVSLKFHMDTSLASLLGTTDSLGKVDVHEAPSGKTVDIMTQLAKHLDKLPPAIDLMDADVRLVKVVSRKDVGLGEVDLAGGTFLQDGRLLIADFAEESYRLILFDDQFGVVNTLSVSGQPTGVAFRGDASDIFVCFYDGKIINYSLCAGGTLIQKKEIATSKCVWSVVPFDEVLITAGDEHIDSISTEESEIDEINIRLETYNSQIGQHDVNQTYYYTDGVEVVCKRLGGEEVFRHDTGRPVWGMAVDQKGNSYASYTNELEGKPGGVYQVSHDGRRSGVLVEALCNITDPYVVIFHRTRNLFVVTSNNEDTLFEVYKFIP